VLAVAPQVAAPPVESPTGPDSQRLTRDSCAVEVELQGAPRSDSTSAHPEVAHVDSVHIDSVMTATTIVAADGPSRDIDVKSYENTASVEHYLSRFTGPARDYLQTGLSEGTRYETMIRQSLRDGGIPEDMYYLALVESDFDPNSYSRSAAVGMWQFMSSTARGMGLRVDWWVDERRDPVRSTRAAVQFIRGLRDQFGSIYLAAAAYNGGPGRVAKGLSKYADDLDSTAGDDLFFALADKKAFRNETRDYVPQIIAAALIGKDPARYDLKITEKPAFAYDSVTVPALTSLASVAMASGSTVSALKELNPQILRGTTPPGPETMLRVPVGSGANFDSILATIPDSARRGAVAVRTKTKDTPEKLAKLTGVKPGRIAAFNKGLKRTKSGALVAGQVVYVPTKDAVAAATSVPDPSIEIWGSSVGTHLVKKGETLGRIALRYHTTTSALMKLNRMKKSIIFPGQSILVSPATARQHRN
jgi:membrane-bound lytic murein transglycosylase D